MTTLRLYCPIVLIALSASPIGCRQAAPSARPDPLDDRADRATPHTQPEQTGNIAGRVRTNLGRRPVSGAAVYVEGIARGTLTEKDGRYQLRGVPVGRHTLVVELIGYLTVRRPGVFVREDSITRADFALVGAPLTIGGCEYADDDTAGANVDLSSDPLAAAERYAETPIHGVGCYAKGLRRRITNDSTIIDIYADILEERRACDRCNPGVMMTWVARSGRLQHVPLFLEHAPPDHPGPLSGAALEGLTRTASRSELAFERIVEIAIDASDPDYRYRAIRSLVRVNTPAARGLLRRIPATALPEQLQNPIRQVLVYPPCERGLLWGRKGRYTFECAPPEP